MKIKPVALAVYATMGLALSGCIDFGDPTTTDNEKETAVPATVTLQGTGADGLLQGAKVCLDENQNWQCDDAEPQTTTDNQGKYQLKLEKTAAEVQNLNVIIEAGATTPGNETGDYLALVRQVDDPAQPQDVTPITTMLAQGVTEEQLKIIMGASGADIDLKSADTVVNNPVVKAYALSVAKALATKLKQATSTQAMGDVIKNATQELATTLKAQTTAISADELAQQLQQVQVEVVSTKLEDVLVAVQARDEKGNILKNAQVEITLKDNLGNEIQADNGQTIITAQTDDSGRALVRLPVYSEASNLPKDADGSVYATAHVKVIRKGYAPIERVIRNVRLGDNLTVRAAMVSMPVKTAKVAATLQFNGAFVASEQPLVFALVGQGDQKRVLTGSEALAQAAGDADVLIEIPQARIDTARTKAVTAAIRGFDSTNQDAVQSFPGEFKGIGKPLNEQEAGVSLDSVNAEAQAQAGEEVQLVSAAFARIELTDQNGEPLTFSTADAQAAAVDPIKVYLKIPNRAYSLVREQGDQSETAQGWQIPVYVFDGAQWKYVGLGTVVTYNATDGNYQPVESDTGFDDTITYYAEIEITQATQWLEWINLDWPIEINAPKALTGSVVYEGETPEPYTGGAWIVKDNQWDWVWVEEGAIQDVSRPDSILSGAELLVYNDRFNFIEQRATIQPDGDAYKVNMTLQNPYRCQIQGVVKKEGVNGDIPLAGVYVFATSGDYTYYQDGYTNPAGEITLAVPCEKEMTVSVNEQSLSVNVNSQQENNETEDNGTIARFNLTLRNINPYLWASVDKPQLKLGTENTSDTFTIYADAYDVDDSAVSLSINCPAGTTELANTTSAYSYKQLTCQVDSNIFGDNETQKLLTAKVIATDVAGGTATENIPVLVERLLENNPPIVLGLTRDSDIFIPCEPSGSGAYSCSDTVRATVNNITYTVEAYDPDGDDLTYSGHENITVLQANSVETITVSDGSNTVNVTLNLSTIQNEPPAILAAVNPASVRAGNTATLEVLVVDDAELTNTPVVKVNNTEQAITVQDKDPDPYVGRWQIDLPTSTLGEHQVEVSFTDSEGAISTYTLTYEVVGNQAPEAVITSMPAQVFLPGDTTLNAEFVVVDDQALSAAEATLSLLDENGNSIVSNSKTGLQLFNTLSLALPADLVAGTYTVRLVVKDAESAQSEDKLSVEVIKNEIPTETFDTVNVTVD